MINWWLIVVLVIISLLCVAFAIYVLFFFLSEDDDNGAYVAKIIIVIGIILTTGVVLLLPFDVANAVNPVIKEKHLTSLDMQLLWQIVIWLLICMSIVIVPFTVFFYEVYDADKPKIIKQIKHASFYTLAIILLFGIICGVCYTLIGIAIIPVDIYEGNYEIVNDIDEINSYIDNSILTYIDIKVSIFTYCVGILHCISWVFFFFYGGVGLISCPIDLFFGFIRRPKAITASVFAQEMTIIATKADVLLSMAVELQNSTRSGSISSSRRRMINILRKETYILEAQQEQIIWAYTRVGGSPFVIYGRLLLGFISLFITISWVLHIFLYNIFEVSFFLNEMLTTLDSVFSLFGVIAYGVLVFYLLWITFEGQIRLGIRLVFFQIYPLKPHDTTLNSLLFNVGLFLLTSIAVLGFATRSFKEYTAWTAINTLMNTYIMHLKYIGFFVRWAQLLFVGISLISLPWVILCPIHKKQRNLTRLRLDK